MPKTIHGMSYTRTYDSWGSMIQRCTNSNTPDYKRYGGRGIKVCARWMTFENFYEDMGERPINTSLDRIDNNGDYTPENCTWSSSMQQAINRRSNKLLTYKGETKPLIVWVRELHLEYARTLDRLEAGWSVEKAFETKLYVW